jgi:hypothetical protein
MDRLPDQKLLDLHVDPMRRRWFLLVRALEHMPLHAAIELVERAEAFLAAGHCRPPAEVGAPACSQSDKDTELLFDTARDSVAPGGTASIPQGDENPSGGPVDASVILGLLADGVSDADIMNKFGLTKRQLLGFRLQMGCETEAVSTNEVVRFLRQQGDIVVGRDEDGFLVNGRFRMTLPDLVARANRIRARQRKTLFQVQGAGI